MNAKYFFKIKLITSLSYALMLLSLLGIMNVAQAATCYQFVVDISGVTASPAGKQQFTSRQFAVLRDAGYRDNLIELFLIPPGDLNRSPQIGQILLLSNTAVANNAGLASARIDMGRIQQLANTTFRFQLDSGASVVQPPPNVFITPGANSAPGGLGGLGFLPNGNDLLNQVGAAGNALLNYYYIIPRNGIVDFAVGNNAIQGKINISGSSFDNFNLQGQYVADFKGRYNNRLACN